MNAVTPKLLNTELVAPDSLLSASSLTSDYLEGLNPEQRAAVCFGEGQLLIFAGAGSGKTRVLTRRIARLVNEGIARPDQILAVTFTNKAANEMKQRVLSLLQAGRFQSNPASRAYPSSIWVSTFHSTAVRILRQHAEALGFAPSFAIYDTTDSISVLKRCFEMLKIDPRALSPRAVLSQIDRAKNSYRDPESFRSSMRQYDEATSLTADLYAEYQNQLYAANAMDFGDLLCNTVSLFELRPEILEYYQERFRHILVDEYQDTNKVQYRLVQLLAAKYKNLCVVGDDDQSIYAFRGATVENILNFQRDYPDAEVITLETNYRSTKTILAAANAVIAKNVKRRPKAMRTDNVDGEKIICLRTYDEQSEARWVVQQIVEIAEAGTRLSDVAIFYRTNSQSRALEEALCSAALPYQIFGGQRFYDRKEIKDILAYYKLLVNPTDNEAFLRIINTPVRGIGPSALAGLRSYAIAQKLAYLPALKHAFETDAKFLVKTVRSKFYNFVELLEGLEKEAEHASHMLTNPNGHLTPGEMQDAITHLLQAIVDRTKYIEKLEKLSPEEAQSRIDNIQELYRVAAGFVRQNLEQQLDEAAVTLESFLDRVSLVADSDGEPETLSGKVRSIALTGSVSLMTLHVAKGLEFQSVFLTGLEEGLLPHVRSLDSMHALEEERRLAYVGVTRAKQRLFISYASSRQTFGKSSWYAGMPSRFLNDIPQGLVQEVSLSSDNPDSDIDVSDLPDYNGNEFEGRSKDYDWETF